MKKLFKNKAFIIITISIAILLVVIPIVSYFAINIVLGAYTPCGNGKGYIKSLNVWSLAENDEGIYHVNYPSVYYEITKEGGGRCIAYYLESAISPSEMSVKDYNYFVNYVENLPDTFESISQAKKYTDDLCSTYYVALEYVTEDGEIENIFVGGYNKYPIGWNQFINRVNKVSGDDYLTARGGRVEFSDELLTEWFGVTDDDVREGTLQDVIDYRLLDIYDITKTFSMQQYIEVYNVSVHEDWLEPYYPYEIVETESTEEEYDVFVKDLRERIDDPAWVELTSNKSGLRYFENAETGQCFFIGRTADFDKMELTEPYSEEYPLWGLVWSQLDTTSLGTMTLEMDFVYSPCGKYIFAAKEFPEEVFDFLEIEY